MTARQLEHLIWRLRGVPICFGDHACMFQTPHDDERRQALGQVLEDSVDMEELLGLVFCALIGSKYAAIVAGGQNASWLIENCKAIVKFYRELNEEDKAAINDALTACSGAYERRNQLVHAYWARSPRETEVMVANRSRWRTFKHVVENWTLDEIHEVDLALRAFTDQLLDAALDARGLGAGSMDLGEDLAREEYESEQSGPPAPG